LFPYKSFLKSEFESLAMAAPASQPVRSTLLDGNHAFPPLYACYLLRSKTRPNVTYIGSSPDPPRRLRQHNGEITQGAVSTMKYRPWEMQMIVYG
jgi:structure-specific endonuclease subunit SLX1